MRAFAALGFVAAAGLGCSHSVVVNSVPPPETPLPAGVLSSSLGLFVDAVRVPEEVVLQDSFDSPICGFMRYPLTAREAVTQSVVEAIRAVADDIRLVDAPIHRWRLKENGLDAAVLVRVEAFAISLSPLRTMVGMDFEAQAEITLSLVATTEDGSEIPEDADGGGHLEGGGPVGIPRLRGSARSRRPRRRSARSGMRRRSSQNGSSGLPNCVRRWNARCMTGDSGPGIADRVLPSRQEKQDEEDNDDPPACRDGDRGTRPDCTLLLPGGADPAGALRRGLRVRSAAPGRGGRLRGRRPALPAGPDDARPGRRLAVRRRQLSGGRPREALELSVVGTLQRLVRDVLPTAAPLDRQAMEARGLDAVIVVRADTFNVGLTSGAFLSFEAGAELTLSVSAFTGDGLQLREVVFGNAIQTRAGSPAATAPRRSAPRSKSPSRTP